MSPSCVPTRMFDIVFHSSLLFSNWMQVLASQPYPWIAHTFLPKWHGIAGFNFQNGFILFWIWNFGYLFYVSVICVDESFEGFNQLHLCVHILLSWIWVCAKLSLDRWRLNEDFSFSLGIFLINYLNEKIASTIDLPGIKANWFSNISVFCVNICSITLSHSFIVT